MAKKRASIIDTTNYNYDTIRVRGKDGKVHYIRGNADSVMKALALHTIVHGKSLDQVARANKIELGKHTNVGQQRMAIGNSLRGKIRNGEPVTIGEVTVKSLEQRVAVPTEKEAARPAKKAVVKKRSARPRKAKQGAGDEALAA